jgi:signal peptidase I
MEPTLERESILIANSWSLLGREPTLGEIVVFWRPSEPKVQYVARIAAKGGDTIAVSGCMVRLNGQLRSEPYALTEGPDPHDRCNFKEVLVPTDHYYVLGDNRLHSEDSRFWGFLPRENIVARAVVLSP